MRHVRDPLTVPRDVSLAGRHSRQINGKLLRLAIQADQIEAALLADYE